MFLGSKLGHHHMNNMSALQQHVAFFDRNKDGMIYPWETYQAVINMALSYTTSHSLIPSLLFPIYVDNIQKGKHGSDSEVYDSEGGFDSAKFDAIFSKYACTYSDKLTYSELQAMLKGNRDVNDISGWIAARIEWSFLYKLAKSKEGFLEKDGIRGLYDGSLFEYFEKQHSASAQAELS